LTVENIRRIDTIRRRYVLLFWFWWVAILPGQVNCANLILFVEVLIIDRLLLNFHH